MLIRIVHHRRRLIYRRIVSFVLELQRTIRQPAIAVVEISVHRPRIDHFAIRNFFLDFAVIAIQQDLDAWMIQHVLKQTRVTMQGHRLVRIGKVSIVPVRARRHARSYAGIQLGWIESPLLAAVIAKELFVQLATYPADNYVF
jgi:hypothetical protein